MLAAAISRQVHAEEDVEYTEDAYAEETSESEETATSEENSTVASESESVVISEEYSEEVSEEISEEVSEEISEEVSEEISEKVSEEISEEVSEEISEEISEEKSTEASEDNAEDISEESSDTSEEDSVEIIEESDSDEALSETGEEVVGGVNNSYYTTVLNKRVSKLSDINIPAELSGYSWKNPKESVSSYQDQVISFPAVNGAGNEVSVRVYFVSESSFRLSSILIRKEVIKANSNGTYTTWAYPNYNPGDNPYASPYDKPLNINNKYLFNLYAGFLELDEGLPDDDAPQDTTISYKITEKSKLDAKIEVLTESPISTESINPNDS